MCQVSSRVWTRSPPLRRERAKSSQRVVFTNGCFDLLHRGHVHILRQAKAAGDLLIVAINSDSSVKSIKGASRPILPETDRVELIAAMEMVDYVVLFDEPDPYRLIAAIKPNVLAKGGDWSADKIVGADVVAENGGSDRGHSLFAGIFDYGNNRKDTKLKWPESVQYAESTDQSVTTSVMPTTSRNVPGALI